MIPNSLASCFADLVEYDFIGSKKRRFDSGNRVWDRALLNFEMDDHLSQESILELRNLRVRRAVGMVLCKVKAFRSNQALDISDEDFAAPKMLEFCFGNCRLLLLHFQVCFGLTYFLLIVSK